MYRIFSLFFVLAVLTACNSSPSTAPSEAHFPPEITAQDLSFIGTHLSSSDLKFMEALKNYTQLSAKIMDELDNLLVEFQQTDELLEAKEAMASAKQEILFIRNRIHNDFQPQNPGLLKIQLTFEQLLMSYFHGLSIELTGMENGNMEQMKEGFRLTETSKGLYYHFINSIKDLI